MNRVIKFLQSGHTTLTPIGPIRFYGLTILCAVVGFYGYLSLTNSVKLSILGVKTTAVIVEVESMTSSGDVSFRPIFEFVDEAGKTITTKQEYYENKYDFEIGQPLNIIYLPSDPMSAKINTWDNLWFIGPIMLFMALVFQWIAFQCYGTGKQLKAEAIDMASRHQL